MKRSRRARLWYRHVEPVQRDGYEAIQPDQIDELSRAVLAECLDGLTVGQLGQHAMID